MSETGRVWVIQPESIKARHIAALAASSNDLTAMISVASEITGEDAGDLPIADFMALMDALTTAVNTAMAGHQGRQFAALLGGKEHKAK